MKFGIMQLKQRINQQDILTEIKFTKWQCIGHALRKEDESISRVAIEWNQQGMLKCRGRSRITFCSSVRAKAQQTGMKLSFWPEKQFAGRSSSRLYGSQ